MAQDDKNMPPPAQGIRQQWGDMPQKIRDGVQAYIGAEIIRTETQSGGFSPGVADRIFTSDDRCFFLKALGTDINTTSVAFHRKEIKINASFPENAFAPKMLWSVDDADDTGWAALLFDNIAGVNPPIPWQSDDLRRVGQALQQLTETLTPSPIASVPSASEYFTIRVHGWQKIKDNYAANAQNLDDWSKRHLDTLCALERHAPEAVAGDTLVHFDIRADNILITENEVWFVDWPHACTGTSWLDVVLFASSVAMQSDLSPEDLIRLQPAVQTADPQAVTAAIVSLAGSLTLRALAPSPRGLPTLRKFQAALAQVTRQWVTQRTELE